MFYHNTRTITIILLILIATGIGTAQGGDPVSVVREQIKTARDVASDLTRQASECRRYLATNPPGSICNPGYSNCSGQRVNVSAAQADRVGSILSGWATQAEARLPELERKQKRVLSDQNAIRNLGFQTTADTIMEYQEMSEEGRRTLKKASISALIDSAFQAASLGASVAYSPTAAKNLMVELRKPLTAQALGAMGVKSSELIDLVVKLNTPSATKLSGQLLQILISKLSKIKSAVMLNQRDPAVGLKVLKMFLSWMVKSPALKFLVTEIEWTIGSVYNFAAQWIASYNIDALTNLEEANLISLKKLHKLLESDVELLLNEIKTLPKCPAGV